MAKPALQIVATSSNAGKSYLVAGFCRLFHRLGYRVAPFKAQNMALNAAITPDGLEIGRAQAMQAEAAGCRPQAEMNPILLKPQGDRSSQLIVLGEVRDQVTARSWAADKNKYWPEVQAAYEHLRENFDLIIVEGAGSPTEINLDLYDFVNLGLAQRLNFQALLVGDIDRGGVFANLYGHIALLPEDLRRQVGGLLINKFRGDPSLLESGVQQIEGLTGCPLLGIIPYTPLALDDEDSLSDRLLRQGSAKDLSHLQIVVPRLPRLANFTDLTVFESYRGVELRYVDRPQDLDNADFILLPGSKSSMDDLAWLRSRGLDQAILAASARGVPIWGICGGYQILGQEIADPLGIEGKAGSLAAGLALLPIRTVFERQKVRGRYTGKFTDKFEISFQAPHLSLEGYALHQGVSSLVPTETAGETPAQALLQGYGAEMGLFQGHVYGSYWHGIFDAPGVAEAVLAEVLRQARKRGRRLCPEAGTASERLSYAERRQMAYDSLAACLREHLDWPRLLPVMGFTRQEQKTILELLHQDRQIRSF